MLRSTNDLKGYAIRATDGTIGHLKDLYFDDVDWVVRYLVVDTGNWLASRKVLISPMAIGQPNEKDKVLPVSITKTQVKNSPDVDTDKPVSRQHELQYLDYYGYPRYWGGDGLWGGGIYPSMMLQGYAGFVSAPNAAELNEAYSNAEALHHDEGDPHLRSANEVLRYHTHATDGDIGHVQSLLVDDETWAIRYLIIDTSNWWGGHKVLVVPQWIQDVSWADARVSVNLTRQAVKEAPPYDAAAQLRRSDEIDVHDHYGRVGYWTAEDERKTPQSGD